MENTIRKIEDLSATLKGLLPLSAERQSELDKKFMLEFNFNSNHMEGNTLTYSETKLLLFFGQTTGNHTKREQDEMEAHQVAFQLIKDWAKDKERPLTEAAIKNLNEVILVKPFWKEAVTPDGQHTKREIKVGDYKQFPNSVRLSNGEIFEYASVADTPILMGELLKWYNEQEEKEELHPVALAAMMHYKLVRIHPFDDGNGRISRLLMNYILLRNDLPPVVVKSADKANYLAALNRADAGDLNAFVSYIAEQLVWSLEVSIKAAQGESIEESDDVEKTISVWKKKHLKQGDKPVKRDDTVVYNLYTDNLKNLFEQFEEKHRVFYDLFLKVNNYALINGSGIGGIAAFNDRFIQKYKVLSSDKVGTEYLVNERRSLDNFHELSVQISLIDYQHNGTNVFSLHSQIKVVLEPYKYTIILQHSKIEKAYKEVLSKEDTESLLKIEQMHLFEEIKSKAGTST